MRHGLVNAIYHELVSLSSVPDIYLKAPVGLEMAELIVVFAKHTADVNLGDIMHDDRADAGITILTHCRELAKAAIPIPSLFSNDLGSSD